MQTIMLYIKFQIHVYNCAAQLRLSNIVQTVRNSEQLGQEIARISLVWLEKRIFKCSRANQQLLCNIWWAFWRFCFSFFQSQMCRVMNSFDDHLIKSHLTYLNTHTKLEVYVCYDHCVLEPLYRGNYGLFFWKDIFKKI